MRFVIVTGMSGAGKSTTLKMMEDMGYFCVDNMPIPLMTKLTELLIVPNGEITKIALGLDILQWTESACTGSDSGRT